MVCKEQSVASDLELLGSSLVFLHHCHLNSPFSVLGLLPHIITRCHQRMPERLL